MKPHGPKQRQGIDDQPSHQTKAICGAHFELICDLSKAIGETRATILRTIIARWAEGDEGTKARAVVATWRAKQR